MYPCNFDYDLEAKQPIILIPQTSKRQKNQWKMSINSKWCNAMSYCFAYHIWGNDCLKHIHCRWEPITGKLTTRKTKCSYGHGTWLSVTLLIIHWSGRLRRNLFSFNGKIFQWKDLSNATDNIKRNCNNYERQRQIDTSQILNATDNIKRKCNHYERQRQIDLCQILNQQYFIKIQNHCLLPMQ